MNPQQRKIVGYAVISLLALLVIMYVIKYVKAKFAELDQQHTTPYQAVKNTVVKSTTICTKGNDFPLEQGSCGSNVVALQKWLNARSNYGLKTDGKFGPKTKSALMAATGKATVIEAEYKSLQLSGVPITPGGTPISNPVTKDEQYPKDLTAFAIAVQTDLDTYHILTTRKNEGVWAQMLLLTPVDLKTVASYIGRVYGKSLFSQISSVQWSINDNIDNLLKNKLTAAGLGA